MEKVSIHVQFWGERGPRQVFFHLLLSGRREQKQREEKGLYAALARTQANRLGPSRCPQLAGTSPRSSLPAMRRSRPLAARGLGGREGGEPALAPPPPSPPSYSRHGGSRRGRWIRAGVPIPRPRRRCAPPPPPAPPAGGLRASLLPVPLLPSPSLPPRRPSAAAAGGCPAAQGGRPPSAPPSRGSPAPPRPRSLIGR